jgi:hypothetical protein
MIWKSKIQRDFNAIKRKDVRARPISPHHHPAAEKPGTAIKACCYLNGFLPVLAGDGRITFGFLKVTCASDLGCQFACLGAVL